VSEGGDKQMLLRVVLAIAILLAIISTANAGEEITVNVSADPSTVVIGKDVEVTLTLKGATEEITSYEPLDVMLVMDCSGSMKRYGDIIAGPYNVELTTSYKKVGEFTLSSTSDVEVMLQTLPGRGFGADVYLEPYDKFYAYIKKGSWKSNAKIGYSTVRWYNVEPGTYEVYAKLGIYVEGKSQPNRVFAVELPPKRIDGAKNAAKSFIDLLDESKDRLGLVKFHSSDLEHSQVNVITTLYAFEKNSAKWAVNGLPASGGTPMGEGLKVAIDHLIEYGREDAVKVIILFTDGWWNMGCNPIDQANRAKDNGIIIYTIGWGGVNEEELREIASITGGEYYYASTSEDLEQIYEKIAKKITKIVAKNITVEFELSDDVEYVGGATIEPDIEGKMLKWSIDILSADETWEVKFKVKPKIEGTVNINTPDSEVAYYMGDEMKEVEIPVVNITVNNNPPEINVNDRYEVTEGETLTFTVTASDPDGHNVTVSAENLPENASFDGYTFTWTPDESFVSAGFRDVTVTFVATDEFGSSATNHTTIRVFDKQSVVSNVVVTSTDISITIANKDKLSNNTYNIGDVIPVILNITSGDNFTHNVTIVVKVNGKGIFNETFYNVISTNNNTTFVPNAAGTYNITVCAWNTTNSSIRGSDYVNINVYVKPIQ